MHDQQPFHAMIKTFHIWSTVSQPCHDQCSCHKLWSMIIHDQCSEIFSTSGTSWTGTSCFFFFSPVIIASWTICSYMKFYETYPYDQQWSMITAWLRDCWSCMKSVDHSMKRLLIIHERLHIHIIMKIIVTPRFDPESSIYINCITKLFAIIAIINLQLAYQNCIWASKSGPRHIMLKTKSVGQS